MGICIFLFKISIKSCDLYLLIESTFQILPAFAHHIIEAVVLVAIVPDQVHISHEGAWLVVAVVRQFLPHGAQVHRIGNYVEVVQDAQLNGIDWF